MRNPTMEHRLVWWWTRLHSYPSAGDFATLFGAAFAAVRELVSFSIVCLKIYSCLRQLEKVVY
jgi:hypothetical protein